MSSYCTKADIYPDQIETLLVVRLTDDTKTKTEMDAALEAIVDKAIEDASAEIDGYCQKIYTVPLSPVSDLIRKYAVDMAIYNLYARRDSEIPEVRKNRYDQAVAYLKLVTKGEASIGAATPTPAASTGEVSFSSNTGQFTRSKLENF